MSGQPIDQLTLQTDGPWYRGITRYQWLVLIIASLGWVFDVFEGQIFVASMNKAMPALVPAGTPAGTVNNYKNIAMAAFLLGGALGGVLFGMLSDRIGRKKTMSLTIIMYSLFTCLSAFSMSWWHMVLFRFLVAMGVGGEWAVASTMVAEEFPKRARARVSGIFHASSVFGTYLAIVVSLALIGNDSVKDWADRIGYPSAPWRIGFGLGILPALLIIWVRRSLKEPQSWLAARSRAQQTPTEEMGRVLDLFRGDYLRSTLVGVTLAAVGLATFWGVHIYGKDILRRDVSLDLLKRTLTESQWEPTKEHLLAFQRGLAQFPLENEDDATFRRKAIQSLESIEAFLGRFSGPTLLADDDWREFLDLLKDWIQLRNNSNYLKRFFQKHDDPVLDALITHDPSIMRWDLLGMFLVTTGGGIGLLCFGPLCERIGRRSAFLFFHLGGLGIALICFQAVQGVGTLIVLLPIFGFLTLGMHAGYAIYFPELYPTRLRGTGAGFCFNFGRILAAPILIISGKMQTKPAANPNWWDSVTDVFALEYSLEKTASILSGLFLLGIVVLVFAPETKGKELPE